MDSGELHRYIIKLLIMTNNSQYSTSNYQLISVLRREWTRMTSRRLYFGVCIVLPLFTLFFMATIFGNGQMENIPIGIVDQDNTATSRTITRNISAVPTFKVTRHFTNEAAVKRYNVKRYMAISPSLTILSRMPQQAMKLLSPIIIIMHCSQWAAS